MTKQFMALTVVCLLTVVLAACAQPGAATPTATTEPGPPAAASEIEAIAPVAAITGMPAGSDGFDWWNDTTFYEIFVRSFSDSDGDGIGDFDGLTAKLDYLNDGDPETTTDLGITGIWLMPIMESPSYHGYDVTDYFKVNPEYGTEEDFKRFLEEAHNRGIRVVIDMVLNHTSNDHPWFEDSETPGAEHDNWYVWSNEDPGFAGLLLRHLLGRHARLELPQSRGDRADVRSQPLLAGGHGRGWLPPRRDPSPDRRRRSAGEHARDARLAAGLPPPTTSCPTSRMEKSTWPSSSTWRRQW